jgi:hypothetical protein
MDFLFPQQWDYRVIGTPTAWQVLRTLNRTNTFGDPVIYMYLGLRRLSFKFSKARLATQFFRVGHDAYALSAILPV